MLEFMTHKSGRKIYRVFKDGEPGITRMFTFSFVDDGEEFGPATFDVRRLPTWHGTGAFAQAPGTYPVSTEVDKIKQAIEDAMDEGFIP